MVAILEKLKKTRSLALPWVNGYGLPRKPVPVSQIPDADLVGIKGVRTRGDKFSQLFQDDLIKSIRQERKGDFPLKPDGSACYRTLSLSGGGARGAFGAGYIYGWTQMGTRPRFKLVTGISTGALVAPIAFLGPEYNEELKQIFTNITAKDVFRVRNVVSWLWNESFADTDPLHKLIKDHIDDDKLKATAQAHSQGSRLYIGTTNLDAQCLTVWNMGAIAQSEHPDALKLFQDILLASASIPSLFPPVLFDVETGGEKYDEMHVDGETTTGVFFYPNMVDLQMARKMVFGENTPLPPVVAHIICNGKLSSSPGQIPRSLLQITRRALATINKAHGREHMYHLFNVLQRNQYDLNYIGIPEDCVLPDNKPAFDKDEMNRLFNLGFDMARSGYAWHKYPPGLQESHQTDLKAGLMATLPSR